MKNKTRTRTFKKDNDKDRRQPTRKDNTSQPIRKDNYAVNASDTPPGCLWFQNHATQGTGWVRHQHCIVCGEQGRWWGFIHAQTVTTRVHMPSKGRRRGGGYNKSCCGRKQGSVDGLKPLFAKVEMIQSGS